MPLILFRIVTATLTFFAVSHTIAKSHPAERNVVQVTVSRDGALETFETLSGKIKVEGQTFKVWRNTLILCGHTRKCRVAE